MTTTYKYDDELNDVVGNCEYHGEFQGDAVGCPECFAESEAAAEAQEDENWHNAEQERINKGE